MTSTEEPCCPPRGLVREQMEPLQQSAATARLPTQLGSRRAAPQLLLHWSLCFLAALRNLSWCLAVALGASQAAVPRLVRQEEQPCRDCQKHKSSHHPAKTSNVLFSGTCYLLLLVYSGSLAFPTGGSSPKRWQTHWPVLALSVVPIPCPELRIALGLWKPSTTSIAVYGSVR